MIALRALPTAMDASFATVAGLCGATVTNLARQSYGLSLGSWSSAWRARMQDQRNSAFGVASRFGMNAVAGFGRLSLLLILAMCSALGLGDCRQEGVLDPQGPIASARRLLVFKPPKSCSSS